MILNFVLVTTYEDDTVIASDTWDPIRGMGETRSQ